MDSYRDVSGQCCGCGRMSCGVPFGNAGVHSDFTDMTAAPWSSWSDDASYPYPGVPTSPAGVMSCPSSQAGVLEQQFPIAMAYVPWQQWQSTYAPERALIQGTIFPELDLQFNYGRCSR